MGVRNNSRSSMQYFRASDGKFKIGKDPNTQTYDEADGIIQGVRLHQYNENGQDAPEPMADYFLQIQLSDIETGEMFTISGRFLYERKGGRPKAALWARMVIDRLANKENALKQGEWLLFRVWGGDDPSKRVTFGTIYRINDSGKPHPTPLVSMELKKTYEALGKTQMEWVPAYEKAANSLIDFYGDFKTMGPMHEAGDGDGAGADIDDAYPGIGEPPPTGEGEDDDLPF